MDSSWLVIYLMHTIFVLIVSSSINSRHRKMRGWSQCILVLWLVQYISQLFTVNGQTPHGYVLFFCKLFRRLFQGWRGAVDVQSGAEKAQKGAFNDVQAWRCKRQSKRYDVWRLQSNALQGSVSRIGFKIQLQGPSCGPKRTRHRGND